MTKNSALNDLGWMLLVLSLAAVSIQASAQSIEYSPHPNLITTDIKPQILLVVGDDRAAASIKALQKALKRGARKGEWDFAKVHVDELRRRGSSSAHVVFASGISNDRWQQLEDKITAGLMIDVDHWLSEDAYSPGWSVTVPGGSGSGGYGENGDLNWSDFSLPFGSGSWGIPDLGDPFSQWTDIDWEDLLEPRDLEGDFGKSGGDTCNVLVWFISDDDNNIYPVIVSSKHGCKDVQVADLGKTGAISIQGEGGTVGGTVELPGGKTVGPIKGMDGITVLWASEPVSSPSRPVRSGNSVTVMVHSKKRIDPISPTPDSSPRSVAMQRKLLEFTQQYESKKAIDAIMKGIPIEGENDQRAVELFKQWLLNNGIEVPTSREPSTDTVLLELRWAFFKASMESANDRPDLWWYLWSKGVPYDPPEPAIPAVFRTYDPATNEFEISVEIRASEKHRVDAIR